MNGKRDRLLELLLGFVLFTAAFPTLIVYRAAIQPNYQWGMFGFFGEGVSWGLVVIMAMVVLGWTTVALGSRGARAPFPVLLVLWNGIWLGSLTYAALRHGPEMTLRGDALGVQIPLAIVGPVLFGMLFLLSLAWWWRRRDSLPLERLPDSRAWKVSRVLFRTAVALAPVGVLLFALGDGVVHTDFDRVAVIVVIAQILLVGAGLDWRRNTFPHLEMKGTPLGAVPAVGRQSRGAANEPNGG